MLEFNVNVDVELDEDEVLEGLINDCGMNWIIKAMDRSDSDELLSAIDSELDRPHTIATMAECDGMNSVVEELLDVDIELVAAVMKEKHEFLAALVKRADIIELLSLIVARLVEEKKNAE